MNLPLADNPTHLQQLCDTLQLGFPLSTPEPVSGGLHHSMWRLETAGGCYAIKQLSADLDPRDEPTARHFELSESVAARFSHCDIPAVVALQQEGRYLQLIDASGYLVYPWVEARALHREDIDCRHAEQVAELFAAMHRADLDVPGLAGEEYAVLSEDRLHTLVHFAHRRNSSRAAELERGTSLFLRLINRHEQAAGFLSQHTVVSHGDMDHKNVLWTGDDQPLIIDWESAHRLNPTHEIVLESLDWSGITLDFSEYRFDQMLSAYLRAGGRGSVDEVEAALHCVQGDWLNWLMYNVGRSIDIEDSRQRQIGSEQVDLALATLWRLERLVPGLLARLT
ncbi:aminoglycoside phosphotransferase family protein [Seongchinamella unica]|uniref:Aminoglycoside phosphotransferase family protein n=1 Tax=Seongchinamella unica TaxID=2547392 RepID=A0A4R5LWE7_9GAMM|nr:aminoglycoside phosphotransferase family protein [Seongchinamella unica]TDG15762.1 aminoglycoside phosphotransferase family protein [Seongchinamella unica]